MIRTELERMNVKLAERLRGYGHDSWPHTVAVGIPHHHTRIRLRFAGWAMFQGHESKHLTCQVVMKSSMLFCGFTRSRQLQIALWLQLASGKQTWGGGSPCKCLLSSHCTGSGKLIGFLNWQLFATLSVLTAFRPMPFGVPTVFAYERHLPDLEVACAWWAKSAILNTQYVVICSYMFWCFPLFDVFLCHFCGTWVWRIAERCVKPNVGCGQVDNWQVCVCFFGINAKEQLGTAVAFLQGSCIAWHDGTQDLRLRAQGIPKWYGQARKPIFREPST